MAAPTDGPDDLPPDADPETTAARQAAEEAEQRGIAMEELIASWQRGLQRGAGIDSLSAASIATALSQLVAHYGRDAALAITDKFREQIASGAFDPRGPAGSDGEGGGHTHTH